ncbi:MAG: DNA-binding protein WhiA, partial [Defluviitaleaceae bacterium]|nr:DNA-binding protein WhiA [Defluviitaleaceae bacterium]
MSFSSEVKAELCGIYPSARHCAIAEIAAIVNTCGGVSPGETGGVRIQTENAVIAKKFFILVKKHFNIQGQVSIRNHKKFAKSRVYSVIISEPEAAARIIHAAGFENGGVIAKGISPLAMQSDCCKRAYIRGAFISGGSLSDPEKTYHLEFVNTDYELLQGLSGLIGAFGPRPKIVKRKSHYIAYLKEGENIVDLLNVMGAHLSLMNLENVRIVKDMRNSVN